MLQCHLSSVLYLHGSVDLTYADFVLNVTYDAVVNGMQPSTGWLGIMMGTRLYYDFSSAQDGGSPLFVKRMNELFRELDAVLGKHGKKGTTGTTSVAVSSSGAGDREVAGVADSKGSRTAATSHASASLTPAATATATATAVVTSIADGPSAVSTPAPTPAAASAAHAPSPSLSPYASRHQAQPPQPKTPQPQPPHRYAQQHHPAYDNGGADADPSAPRSASTSVTAGGGEAAASAFSPRPRSRSGSRMRPCSDAALDLTIMHDVLDPATEVFARLDQGSASTHLDTRAVEGCIAAAFQRMNEADATVKDFVSTMHLAADLSRVVRNDASFFLQLQSLFEKAAAPPNGMPSAEAKAGGNVLSDSVATSLISSSRDSYVAGTGNAGTTFVVGFLVGAATIVGIQALLKQR